MKILFDIFQILFLNCGSDIFIEKESTYFFWIKEVNNKKSDSLSYSGSRGQSLGHTDNWIFAILSHNVQW